MSEKRRFEAQFEATGEARQVRGGRVYMDTINAVFEQFSKDHRNMARVIQIIEHEAQLMARGGEVDFLLLTDCFGYIKAYPDEFHHPFEDIMFRRLRQRSSESAADIQRLLLEHQELSQLSGKLVGQLAAASAGQPVDRETLAQGLNEFAALNVTHMRFEEERAFPAARRHLSSSDWQDVSTVMENMHAEAGPSAPSEQSFTHLFQRIQDDAALHDA